jgi:hypothetical protein
VKSEDTPGLGKVVHGDDGTFKLSENDLVIGNDDANTSSRMLCQCIQVSGILEEFFCDSSNFFSV